MGAQPALAEGEVRARLIADLVDRRTPADAPLLVIEELGLGRGSARADLIVLTADAIVGIEVKSAADSLSRLPAQAGWYARVCDTCVLAGDAGHVAAAADLLPGWWGRTSVDHDGVVVAAPPGPNPDPDPDALAQMLWMPELKAAVAAAGQGGGTAGMERADVARVLVRAAGSDIGRLVREQLLQREWSVTSEPAAHVRVVRQTTPPKKVARMARVRAKHERRALRRRSSS